MNHDFQQIEQACRLLFGEGTPVSREFIDYMQPEGLKMAFRTLALETHPDRAATLGLRQDVLAARFRQVHQAYELLKPYVSGEKKTPEPFVSPARPARPASSKSSARKKREHSKANPQPQRNSTPDGKDFYYGGRLPRHRMRFGQYLYYRQLISWNTLIGALVWQKSVRPRLGSIAIEKGWLAEWQARAIQSSMSAQEFWGEAAIRMGLLDESQIRALLGWQRLQGPLLGRYFTEFKKFEEDALRKYLREHISHNYNADQQETQQFYTA